MLALLPKISISVVSHGQAHMVSNFLSDLEHYCRAHPIEILITLNLPEHLNFDPNEHSFPVAVHTNAHPMGFSSNHNQAFSRSIGEYFCVVNPDIRIDSDPFPALLACLKMPRAGLAAPLVVNKDGMIEDSARKFPTPFKIVLKLFGLNKERDYIIGADAIYPDWVGGMFFACSRDLFLKLNGFDQRYFLYYEDVDICARAQQLGYRIILCPAAKVVHHAQRSSHQELRYFLRHLRSMLRFFVSPVFFRIQYERFKSFLAF